MPTGTAPKTGDALAKVTMRFAQSDGEVAENVFGFKGEAGSGLDASQLQALSDKFAAWWAAGDGSHSYKAFQSVNSQLLLVQSKSLHVVDGAEAVTDVGTAGTDAGGDLPDGVSFVLTSRTAQSGRSHRGRTYLTGLTDNFLSAGDPNVADSDHVTHALDAFGALNAALDGVVFAQGGLVVLSYSNAGAYRANIIGTEVTSWGNSDLFMDYQRRRAPGHNRHH